MHPAKRSKPQKSEDESKSVMIKIANLGGVHYPMVVPVIQTLGSHEIQQLGSHSSFKSFVPNKRRPICYVIWV